MRRSWPTIALLTGCLLLSGAGVWRLVSQPPTSPLPTFDRVVVVGVPGLLWSDVGPAGSPAMNALSHLAALGSLTTRGATSYACPRDGWVTLGAGNRAYAEPASGGCHGNPTSGSEAAMVARLNADMPFGAEPGLLGRSVTCTTTFGPQARLAVLGANRVRALPLGQRSPQDWSAAWARCPLALVAAPTLRGNASPGPLLRVDRLVERVAAAARQEPGTLLLLVGVSDRPGNPPQLHLAMASDGSTAWDTGSLTSPSTDRTPYVQLIDVAPTVLTALGAEVPAAMTGRAFLTTPAGAAPTQVTTSLVDDQVAAGAQRAVAPPLVVAWVLLAAACCLAGPFILRSRRRGVAGGVRLAAVAVAAIPVASGLANLVPWQTTARPGWWLSVALLLATAAVTTVAFAGPWRSSRFGPPVVVAAIGALSLGIDVTTGSFLQFNSLIGYNPIVAGRFTGFGNMPFAVFATCALLTAAAALGRTPDLAGAALVAAAGATIVFLDGTPGLGTDFGGVLALVPALLVMGMIAAGVRVSALRLLASLFAGVVVVTALAVADYSRPADAQTHLGRFVGQVLDGTAPSVVERKAAANIDVLLHSPVALLAPVLLGYLWWFFKAGPSLGHRFLQTTGVAGRAAVAGFAVTAVLGSLLNDSGIAVFVAAGAVAVPMLLSIAAVEAGHQAPGSDGRAQPAPSAGSGAGVRR